MRHFVLPIAMAALLAACANEVVLDRGRGASATGEADAVSSASSGEGGLDMGSTDAGTGGSTSSGHSSGTGDVFDPDEVYFTGSTSPSSCGTSVFVHWSTPEQAIAGLDCDYYDDNGAIRTTDGRFLYKTSLEPSVRELRCDACPYALDGEPYPERPLDNDPVVMEAPCPQPDTFSAAWLVGPEGNVVYLCESGGSPWYGPGGAVVFDDPDDTLQYLGFGGVAFTGGRKLVELGTGRSIEIQGWPDGEILTARATSGFDAFRVVINRTPPSQTGETQELYAIDVEGRMRLIGPYPARPDNAGELWPETSKLDAQGNLFQIGRAMEFPDHVIVRRTTSGESEVVFETAQDVPGHIAGVRLLFTGP